MSSPTTKSKQREHVLWLIAVAQNLRARQPSPDVDLVLSGLCELYANLRNRTTPAGRPSSDPVTPAKIHEVWHYYQGHPAWSQQEIANACNINIGRVSEILHGKRL